MTGEIQMNTWTMITAGGESWDDPIDDPMQRIRPRFIAGSTNVDWLDADGQVNRYSAFGAKIEYVTDPAKKYAPAFEQEANLYVSDRRIVLISDDVSSAFGVVSGLADWATRGAINDAYDLGKRVGLRNRLFFVVQVDFLSLSVVRYYQASWPGRSLLQWSGVTDEHNPYSRELVFTSLSRKVDIAGIAADILSRAKAAKLRNEFGLFNPEQLRNVATVAFQPSSEAYMGQFTDCGLSLPVLHSINKTVS